MFQQTLQSLLTYLWELPLSTLIFVQPRYFGWRNRNRIFRSSRPEMYGKIGVLRNFPKFTGKHLCQRLFFSCEFCKISKNNFFYRTPLVTTSVIFYLISLGEITSTWESNPPRVFTTANLQKGSDRSQLHYLLRGYFIELSI